MHKKVLIQFLLELTQSNSFQNFLLYERFPLFCLFFTVILSLSVGSVEQFATLLFHRNIDLTITKQKWFRKTNAPEKLQHEILLSLRPEVY